MWKSRTRADVAATKSYLRLQIASARIRRSVKRAFIVSGGQPITVRDVLVRAYPKLRRFNDWHRWSCRQP